MDYTFKKIKLSDAERLWLTEIHKANFSPINVKSMKIRLRKELPIDFNPWEIDKKLIICDRLTLIGLWYINRNSSLFSYVSKTIEVTRDLILKNHEIKKITAKEISDLICIGEREAEIALLLIFDLRFFGGASGKADRNGYYEVDFRDDDTAFDDFLRFTTIERAMEDFYTDRNSPLNTQERMLSKKDSGATSETVWKKPTPREIWSDIYRDFDIKQHTFGKNINFVLDKYKRKVIFRDVEHAYILYKNGFYKPAVILAGSVIEELLRLYLKSKNIKAAKNTFDEYITTCDQHGLLKGAIGRLSDSIRHFRNLVHLEKETSEQHKISKAAAATSAVASIFIISNDFKEISDS